MLTHRRDIKPNTMPIQAEDYSTNISFGTDDNKEILDTSFLFPRQVCKIVNYFKEHHLRWCELKEVVVRMKEGQSFQIALWSIQETWGDIERYEEDEVSTEFQVFNYTVNNHLV